MRLWRRNSNASARHRRWSQQLSEQLPMREPTMEGLLEAVEDWRGKRLVISSAPQLVGASGRASGLWLTSAEIDLIWSTPTAQGALQDQIIGHEIGHMVNGDSPESLPMAVMRILAGETPFRHLSPSFVKETLRPVLQATLHRDGYDQRREDLAEDFGTWVTTYLDDIRRSRAADPLVANMRESLGDYW